MRLVWNYLCDYMVALHCENIIILNHECKKYFASTDEIRICDLELTIIVMRFNQILRLIWNICSNGVYFIHITKYDK